MTKSRTAGSKSSSPQQTLATPQPDLTQAPLAAGLTPAEEGGTPEATETALTPAAEASAVTATLELRKKELIDQAVERSGIKKRDAKPVVEAVLAILGEAIGEERSVNLEPMGKLRVTRSKDNPNGRVHVCKLRRKIAVTEKSGEDEKTATDPLAEPGG